MSKIEFDYKKETENKDLRPIPGVSSFVVDCLPQALREVRKGEMAVDELAFLVGDIMDRVPLGTMDGILANPEQRDLATLDLKMLDSSIANSQGTPPDNLVRALQLFSHVSNQPCGMTYEEIVLLNPQSDMRTFTDGQVGQTEAAFYRGHADVEAYLDRAIDNTVRGIQELKSGSSGGIVAASEKINQITEDLEEVGDRTKKIGEQDRSHFSEFRGYLGTHPIRGVKGPSGAFTAGIPTVELLIAGTRLPEDYMAYLRDNIMYFPRDGRQNIILARSNGLQGNSLMDCVEKIGSPSQLVESINSLNRLVRRFRGQHYGAVGRQVPEALAGNIVGTGGESDPGVFLRDRLKIRY